MLAAFDANTLRTRTDRNQSNEIVPRSFVVMKGVTAVVLKTEPQWKEDESAWESVRVTVG